jgi:hypothetical protein
MQKIKVTRISALTGNENTMELAVTTAQIKRYESGEILLQNAFPQLTAPEREFIKSGITPDEWQKYFG